MKTLSLLALFGVFASTSFAQDMSQKEPYSDAYKEMPDGTNVYVGKCKTHEDKKGKTYRVVKKILKTTYPQDFNQAEVKALVSKIGASVFMASMKEFFGSDFEVGTMSKAMREFPDLSDDIAVDQISLLDAPELELIQVNMGYGGGNGGFLVLLMRDGKVIKKLSQSGDGSLEYCDKLVWKK